MEANSCSEKLTVLKAFVEISLSPFVLSGSTGTGKTHCLREVAKDLAYDVLHLNCSRVILRDVLDDRIQAWLDTSYPTLLVIEQYTSLLDGSWDFLVPDSQNRIYFKGQMVEIPSAHRCVFVKRDDGLGHPHAFESQLPCLQFGEYSSSDINDIVCLWTDNETYRIWIVDCYTQLQKNWQYSLCLFELRRLLELCHYYEQKETNSEWVKVKALYTFLMNWYTNDDLERMSLYVPVMTVLWKQYIGTMRVCVSERKGLTEDQCRLQGVLEIFLTIYHEKSCPYSDTKPVLWIEGEAGCGKDYITDAVIQSQGIQSVMRVKGSNVQTVLNCSDEAKKNGSVLIIEEADFLCMDILQQVMDSIDAHPCFALIATVNGVSYAGRQRLSSSVKDRLWIYPFTHVNRMDLAYMLTSKFSTSLTEQSRDRLLTWYEALQISLSPREVFSIVEDCLNSDQTLEMCWLRKVLILKKIRPFRRSSLWRHALQAKKGEALKQYLEHSIPDSSQKLEILKEKLSGSAVKVIQSSALFKSGFSDSEIRCASTLDFLPLYYFIETPEGVQSPCCDEGSHSVYPKQGYVCLELSLEQPHLWRYFGAKSYFKLPIPRGMKPIRLFLIDKNKEKVPLITPIVTDELGYFFVSLSQSQADLFSFIFIDYEESEFNLKSVSFVSTGYEFVDFILPEDISIILTNDQLSPLEKLEDLKRVFKGLRYDLSKQTTQLYEGCSHGFSRVQRFLEVGVGCCYEFSSAFYALVSRYLNLPVRLVSGFSRKSLNLYGVHLCVEVCMDGVWRLFDVTGHSRDRVGVDKLVMKEVKNEDSFLSDVLSDSLVQRGSVDVQCHSYKGLSASVFYEISKRIKSWCYSTRRIRQVSKVSMLPSVSSNKRFCLDLYYRTSNELYESFQLQPDSWEPYFKVLLTARSNVPSCDDIYVLLKMGTPVYMARLDGIYQVYSVEDIKWDCLLKKEEVAFPSEFIFYDNFLDLFNGFRSYMFSANGSGVENFLADFDTSCIAFSLSIVSDIAVVRRLISFFSDVLREHRSPMSFIFSLELVRFLPGCEKELAKLVELLRPVKLSLEQSVIPIFSTEIFHLEIADAVDWNVFKFLLISLGCFSNLSTIGLYGFPDRKSFDDMVKFLPSSVTELSVGFLDKDGLGDSPLSYLPLTLLYFYCYFPNESLKKKVLKMFTHLKNV